MSKIITDSKGYTGDISEFTGRPAGQRTLWRRKRNIRSAIAPKTEAYRENYDKINWDNKKNS